MATARFLKVRDIAVTWMGTWGSLQEYGDSPLGKSLQSTCAVDLRRLPKKKEPCTVSGWGMNSMKEAALGRSLLAA